MSSEAKPYTKADLDEWTKDALRDGGPRPEPRLEATVAELEKFRVLGGGDPRFAFANVSASVENWDNTPDMDKYRQAVFERDRLVAERDSLRTQLAERDRDYSGSATVAAMDSLRAQRDAAVEALRSMRDTFMQYAEWDDNCLYWHGYSVSEMQTPLQDADALLRAKEQR